MIFDAKVEVTCDREGCRSHEFVDLHAGARNTYIADDDVIERELARQGWVCKDGRQFCCEECAEERP